jgi:hypothetical protein
MSTTPADRQLGERAKAELDAVRATVEATEDTLLDALLGRIQDMQIDLMHLADAARAVRELRRMRKARL